MLDLNFLSWGMVVVCSILVGITKTGIPGIGILIVPLMATALPIGTSIGFILGMLIIGDLFAIVYHRHNARWRYMLYLLPAAIAGIVAGYFFLRIVNDQQLRPIIGIIVLVMLGINFWRTKHQTEETNIPTQWWFAACLGFIAGMTSMMANAAGPIMIIYLMAMKLPKLQFVGTSAWFFFIVNWIKVPFSAKLDMMTLATIKLNLMALPFIAVGALLGVFVLKRIPQKTFTAVVQVLAVAAAIKLVF
ncbi:MAG TPA: sulfite exporter TauE/SafE family protein [Syntrophales bacterium]|nr:sulfite exporter TauE/SafE family protein [Geobacteraceae bacterium]HPQ45342.1 sulfite exporter TauE/SafE family protein [Syntrophales bacterium]